MLPLLFLCMVITFQKVCDGKGGLMKNPLQHLATENQMVIRHNDGSYKMAYRHGDGFRAEIKSKDGSVKGVYSSSGGEGENIINSYISDENGYRLTDLGELGIALPPLPHFLHPKAGQQKFPKKSEEAPEEKLELESLKKLPEATETALPVYPFGRVDEANSAIVILPFNTKKTPWWRLGENGVNSDAEVPFGALAGIPRNQIDLREGETQFAPGIVVPPSEMMRPQAVVITGEESVSGVQDPSQGFILDSRNPLWSSLKEQQGAFTNPEAVKNSEASNYPGDTKYPEASHYPVATQYPGANKYPGANTYPGATHYPGANKYPGTTNYPGDKKFTEASQYPRVQNFFINLSADQLKLVLESQLK